MTTARLIGVVSGSGLDITGLLDDVDSEHVFDTVPGRTDGTVPGHDYGFVRGRCGPCRIVLQRGRRHLYEGLSCQAVVQTVDAMHRFGVRTLLFTNVAGALRPDLSPGDLVAIDRLRLWPYVRWPDQPEALPTDFVMPGCDLTAAYQWMHGPCYETRAEIAALRRLGSTVVGMSTAPEVARCRELGIRAGIISCVTNVCGGPQVLTHDHVVAVARQASARLTALVREALPTLTVGRVAGDTL